MIPNKDGIIVSPTEPETDRRKVWFQKGTDTNAIYVKNDNGEYEEFIKKEEKAVATVGLSANQKFTTTEAWESTKINFDNIDSTSGKFSLQNNGIKIGKGISKILVSVNSNIIEAISGTSQMVIRKNNNAIGRRTIKAQNNTYIDLSLSPQIINVKENDVITSTIMFSVAQTNKTLHAECTYLTIQEV